jgi:hypothetical protein
MKKNELVAFIITFILVLISVILLSNYFISASPRTTDFV